MTQRSLPDLNRRRALVISELTRMLESLEEIRTDFASRPIKHSAADTLRENYLQELDELEREEESLKGVANAPAPPP